MLTKSNEVERTGQFRLFVKKSFQAYAQNFFILIVIYGKELNVPNFMKSCGFTVNLLTSSTTIFQL